MKEVMAVIRVKKMNQTKQALADAGISSVTGKDVLGRGASRQQEALLTGEEVAQSHSPRLIAKRLLTVVVPDKLVAKTVKTIIRVNQTGESGDGKIWVLPVLEAVRVRTGEVGDAAIDEM
ncbi:MAG TPA: P-II family nitrogen regulator [Phototrophicaceae bacterium]|nr:P-II family nitrogen regulator [Phototrophicaceae bacterium]